MPKYTLESPAIQYLSQHDKRLAKVIRMLGPLEYQVAHNGYAFLVNQIIGQMLSNQVADVMTQRLETVCQGPIQLEIINQLTDDEVRQIGIARSKVGYIRNLSAAINDHTLDLDQLSQLDDQAVIQQLTQIKGIGTWSAKMYLIFALDRLNVLPHEDVAFLQGYAWAYKTTDTRAAAVQKKCRKWRPYSSLAARYFYHALDQGLTKEPFHLFK